MILVFEFSYASNNDLFTSLISCVLKSDECLGVKFDHAIVKNAHKISLYLSGDENELVRLSEILSNRLPHSLFLCDTNVFVADEIDFANALPKQRVPDLSNITPAQISSFLNTQEICPNEFGVLSDIYFKNEAISLMSFYQCLDEILNDLLHNKTINLSDKYSSFSICVGVDFAKASYIMPTNLKHILRLFIADEATQVCLASFEKPLIKLRTSAIYKAAHENVPKYFHVGLARDIFMYALCSRLAKAGVDFLSVMVDEYFTEPFVAMPCENASVICQGICYLSDSEAGFVKSASDKNFALYALSAYGLGFLKQDASLRVFLSKYKDDEVEIIKNGEATRVLRFDLVSSWQELFSQISKLEGGDRLIENYKKEFSLPSGKLELNRGFFAIFCIAGSLLGLDDDPILAGEAMLGLASEFSANKGVRIEFKMQSAFEFDIVRAIRSTMSFRLAGAGEKNIAYGMAESLAYFLDEFVSNLKNQYDIAVAIGSGSLFYNKTILSLSSRYAGVKFSREYALESWS